MKAGYKPALAVGAISIAGTLAIMIPPSVAFVLFGLMTETSVGKLFLASDDPLRVRAYATRTGLAGHTKNSITDLGTLERELSRVSQSGTARDDEELELGVRCMAAGIYDDQGKLVAGLSISAPADRLDEEWLPKLQATTQAISHALGFKTKDA